MEDDVMEDDVIAVETGRIVILAGAFVVIIGAFMVLIGLLMIQFLTSPRDIVDGGYIHSYGIFVAFLGVGIALAGIGSRRTTRRTTSSPSPFERTY